MTNLHIGVFSGWEVSTVMANNEEGNDSCMYNTNLFFAPILALAQPKISKTSIILNEGDIGMANYENE